MAYIKSLVSCVSQYSELQQRWHKLIVDQQEVVNEINKMDCVTELKDFLLRKQQFECDQHIKSINSSIHAYCKHSIEYMDQKEKMLNELKNVKTCEDITKILIMN